MLGRTNSRRRLWFVLAGFLAISVAIGARLAFWQVVRGDDLSAMAVAQTTVKTEEPTQRGAIYDRTGTVVLASTVTRSKLVVSSDQLSRERRQEVADRLVAILALEGEAATDLVAKVKGGGGYVVLARGLDEATAQRIRERMADGSLSAVSLEDERVRVYPQAGGGPNTTLAAQLLGFVNGDGDGQYGVEQRYQDVLGGSPRVLLARRTVDGGLVADDSDVIDGGAPGRDVTLTIDASLQLAIEEEMLAAWVADRALSVSAVVMDPYTGRDLRPRDVSLVRRQRLPGHRVVGQVAVHGPDREQRLRAGLRVQDGDRRVRAREGRGEAGHDHQRLTGPGPRQGPRPGDERGSPGPGPDPVRGRDRLLAQRRRGEGRPAPRQDDPVRGDDPVRDVGEDGLRAPDRDRRGGRAAGPRERPGRPARGARSTSRTARSGRASR